MIKSVDLGSNKLTVFEEGVFKEILQQMMSVQFPIGRVHLNGSKLFNMFSLKSSNISLAFSNWIQIHSLAVATSLGSFETIAISFRPFNGKVRRRQCISIRRFRGFGFPILYLLSVNQKGLKQIFELWIMWLFAFSHDPRNNWKFYFIFFHLLIVRPRVELSFFAACVLRQMRDHFSPTENAFITFSSSVLRTYRLSNWYCCGSVDMSVSTTSPGIWKYLNLPILYCRLFHWCFDYAI